MLKSLLIATALTCATAFAAGQRVPTNPCPQKYPSIDSSCQQVCQACFQAKYVVGEMGQGDGFWADCVAPLVTGKTPRKQPTNDGREMPQFPANMASAGQQCMAKSGTFWKKAK